MGRPERSSPWWRRDTIRSQRSPLAAKAASTPPSTLPRARLASTVTSLIIRAPLRVTMLITPRKASAPYSDETGPRMISMCLTADSGISSGPSQLPAVLR
jgi:hypothetical protein